MLPTMLGMNPPTKQVVCGKSKLGGYDCMIFDAAFADGTKTGDRSEPISLGGLSAWLHFCTAESMLSFAENLREIALKAMESET